MTNEQLKIILLNIVERLRDQVNNADNELDGAEREVMLVHKGNSFIPPPYENNPEQYEECKGGVIALSGIREVIEDIKSYSDMLSGNKKCE